MNISQRASFLQQPCKNILDNHTAKYVLLVTLPQILHNVRGCDLDINSINDHIHEHTYTKTKCYTPPLLKNCFYKDMAFLCTHVFVLCSPSIPKLQKENTSCVCICIKHLTTVSDGYQAHQSQHILISLPICYMTHFTRLKYIFS